VTPGGFFKVSVTSRGSRRLEEARDELISRVEKSISKDLTTVVSRYFDLVAPEDLVGIEVRDVEGLIKSHVALGKSRTPGVSKVQAISPSLDAHGWQSLHSVVQVVTDDMPFLVDSVSAELSQQGRSIRVVIHPRFWVKRDAQGELIEILDRDVLPGEQAPEGAIQESWISVEIDRESDASDLATIESGIQQVLADVRSTVEDWPAMQAKLDEVISEIEAAAGVSDRERREAIEFLSWLTDNHFTFVGYSKYALTKNTLASVSGAGLGTLRDATSGSYLSEDDQDHSSMSSLMIVTKAKMRSTVHRPVYLDYVGIRQVDASGKQIGEHRFLGLFSSAAYNQSVNNIPVLSSKVADVTGSMGLGRDSHSGKDLMQFLETYPRDEMFQISTAELEDVARRVLQLQERRQVRVFTRTEVFGRYISALVYFPRDRYTTEVRLRMEAILLAAYGATSIDHTARVSESVLARLHFVIRKPLGKDIPDIDLEQLETDLADATRFWEDDFAESLMEQVGEEDSARLLRTWIDSFPESFKEDVPASNAVSHLKILESLESQEAGAIKVSMYTPESPEDGTRRFTIYRVDSSVTLSAVLPMLHDLGVEVIDERAYDLRRKGQPVAWVYDFGLRFDDTKAPEQDSLSERFCSTFMAAWHGAVDSDPFNALVIQAGLSARNVGIIRAYAAYLRQAGTPFSQGYLQQVLLSNINIVQLLVQLFAVRFDPALDQDRDAKQKQLVSKIDAALDAVASLDHDRIMRSSIALVSATLRTNVYQLDADGNYPQVMAFKLDPSLVPDLPLPLPKFEIWVFSPRVEGVHLRFASVARGGLRWSDRQEDFRTEILGLVKAQMVKNTVIVPSGAKGGFVLKRGPEPSDRDAWLAEGIACYQMFIGALLDVTDNLVNSAVVPPQRVVRHDVDDPYLVVAADKGTATFSDIANKISVDRGFWMGDAFASGGSVGYDHKAMGITAKGAWESVKRHFLELGVNTQTQDFTVVGVGDMSGDVFGNGMLLSEHIRLIAAFDHRHIFIDPNPEAAKSFVERQRLFNLPRSSWEDYNVKLISKGGGIYPRSVKSIDLTAEAKSALGIDPEITSVTPNELLTHILLAPVDLLWNGGIGTYIKATAETHAQVGDKANDAIRINGSDIRARVVGEGGNLGATQLGRIEAAHAGVKLNTDAIDNSAGVDTSDHEVNIKILLDQAVTAGSLSVEDRNKQLAVMTDEVGALVLRDNYEQNLILEQARFQAPVMLRVHKRLMQSLESNGHLNRAIEYLPTDSQLDALHAAGQGITSPELSVLMAYVKIDLTRDRASDEIVNEPWCQEILNKYFPSDLRVKYADLMASHPLRKEIISTVMVNDMVNRGGITYAWRAAEESGAGTSEILRAFVVSRDVFGLNQLWSDLENLDGKVSTDCQTELFLESRRLLDRATRWFLQSRGGRLNVEEEIAKFAPIVAGLTGTIPQLLRGTERQRADGIAKKYQAQGVPTDLAIRTGCFLDEFSLLDVIEIANREKSSPEVVAELYFALSERYDIDRMLFHISALARDDRWTAYARSALRSDLYVALAALTSRVVQATKESDSIDSRISQWEAKFAEGVARTRATLNEIAHSEQNDLATLSVALRAIRTLAGQGAS
jgi:glutamate dehydrogenase